MMHGHEKSDPATVATKPANKAEGPSAARPAEEKHAAESVERRAGTKGNADQQSPHRTQRRHRVAQALERIRKVASTHFAVTHPRWEPDAGKPHVRICAGGARQLASLPLHRREFIPLLGGAAALRGRGATIGSECNALCKQESPLSRAFPGASYSGNWNATWPRIQNMIPLSLSDLLLLV